MEHTANNKIQDNIHVIAASYNHFTDYVYKTVITCSQSYKRCENITWISFTKPSRGLRLVFGTQYWLFIQVSITENILILLTDVVCRLNKRSAETVLNQLLK